MEILTTFLYIVFVMSAIVLIVVVLLQEGKGGGFGQFLGEGGQQTFGVGARGINTFTGYVATAFIVCAVVLNIMNRGAGSGSAMDGMTDADFGVNAQQPTTGFGALPNQGGMPTTPTQPNPTPDGR